MENNAYYQTLIQIVNNEKLFNGKNGIVVTRAELDLAEGEMALTEDKCNPMGGLHGGALTTLADCVAGVAAATRGSAVVTLNNTMNYIRRAKTEKVTCVGRVVKSGNNVTFCEVTIEDGAGELVATGSFTFFMLDIDLRQQYIMASSEQKNERP